MKLKLDFSNQDTLTSLFNGHGSDAKSGQHVCSFVVTYSP